jgi:hypothetical protein
MRELFFFCLVSVVSVKLKKNECSLWPPITTLMSSPAVIAQLVQPFIQAAFYGLYVATLIHCLRWLVFADEGWKQRDGVNKLMLITTIIIFLLSTVNLFLQLPLQISFLEDSNNWSIAEEVMTVCKYHVWRLEQKNDRNSCFPRI